MLNDWLLDAVRIGLSACVADRPKAHPDSSRQRKAILQARERREARRMKAKRNTWIPVLRGPEYYVQKTALFTERYNITGRIQVERLPIQEAMDRARRWSLLRVPDKHYAITPDGVQRLSPEAKTLKQFWNEGGFHGRTR